EEELIDYSVRLVEDVFGYSVRPTYVHDTARTVKISAEIIAVIFEDILGAGKHSGSKRVPDMIFNLPPESRERYLIAYLAGDAYPSVKFARHLMDRTAPDALDGTKYSFNTASAELSCGFQYLLASLNKTCSASARVAKPEARAVAVSYNGRERVASIQSKL